LGHPLHPALAQLALGSFMSASLIDAVGGRRRESSGLIAVGLASTVPTVAAGWADWSDSHEDQQRVGLVHAALNAAAVACFAAALLRRRGDRGTGRLLSLRRLAGDVPVFVLRRGALGSDVTVLSNRCPPLPATPHEGGIRWMLVGSVTIPGRATRRGGGARCRQWSPCRGRGRTRSRRGADRIPGTPGRPSAR
jgi:hypothetical protein